MVDELTDSERRHGWHDKENENVLYETEGAPKENVWMAFLEEKRPPALRTDAQGRILITKNETL
jgi:hypothetical protein